MNPIQTSKQQFVEWLTSLPDEHTFIPNNIRKCIIAQFLNAVCDNSPYTVELEQYTREDGIEDMRVIARSDTSERYILDEWAQTVVNVVDSVHGHQYKMTKKELSNYYDTEHV